MWFKYILSVVSATIAEGGWLFKNDANSQLKQMLTFLSFLSSKATYPLDLIKTRLQIQGEIASTKGEAVS